MKADLTLFEGYKSRRVYDEDTEIWWFSVVHIMQVLTQQTDYQTARNYLNVLTNRLEKEGKSWIQQRMMGQETRKKLTDFGRITTLKWI